MTPEERELLNKSVALSEDNNKILHSMRRSMRIAHFMSILYWLFIIGISVGAFYFMQPYINKVMDLYNSVSGMQQQLNSGLNSSSNSIQDLLNKLKIK
jgi:hypothetical protein